MELHQTAYREEATELLTELEACLLELEEAPDDMELIGRAFRAMHTIKGSGGMFGFEDIERFTHEIETVFDLVRSRQIPVTRQLIDLSLAACDQIRKMLDENEENDPEVETITAAFRGLLSDASSAAAQTVHTAMGVAPSEDSRNDITYRIRFRPGINTLATGTNPALLLDELTSLGDCRITAQTSGVPPLQELDPEGCYLYWDIVLTTRRGIDAIRDVFIFIEDDCELTIEMVDDGCSPETGTDYKRIGEILTERGDLDPSRLEHVLKERKPLGEVLVEADMVAPGAVESALAEQQHIRQRRRTCQEAALASSIRVPAERLDALVDLVGELVTVQARLSQTAASRDDSELLLISEQVERLTAELRDNTMGIRMLPIGTTFSKFRRLVRDLANDLGKQVTMITEGGETELDKTVIERLNDPLVHIIRNCVDHGIEPPAVRTAAGKPKQGTVQLAAAHSGAHVLIRISDDGGGLDPEAIRAQCVGKGLIAPDAELNEQELFQHIFLPGFSTSEKITDVSGRGVGMDVVKRSIEALRGSIEISSQAGRGTTLTLKLPLTLAIIDGLLVEIDQSYFVLPLAVVEECIELSRDDIARAHGRRMVNVRGQIVPYVQLRDLFQIDNTRPAIEQIVITEAAGHRVGFVVDQVIGEHQTVIKTLGRVYRHAQEFSGATILADGTVALILDVHRLVESAEMLERSLH